MVILICIVSADDALVQQAALYQLAKPNTYDMKVLHDWMGRAQGGNHFLRGLEAGIFDSPDLVALSARESPADSLTRWISEGFTPWYDKQVRRYLKASSFVVFVLTLDQ